MINTFIINDWHKDQNHDTLFPYQHAVDKIIMDVNYKVMSSNLYQNRPEIVI